MKRPTAEQIISRFDSLKSGRGTWESHWQEIADFVMPYKNSITKRQAKGNKRNDDIIDDTALQANDKLAAGIFGFLCPPKEQWFKYTTSSLELETDEEVQNYFGHISRIVMKALYQSNFALEMHEDFIDLGSLGTSNVFVEGGDKRPFRFQNIPIASYVIAENAYGEIDTVLHKFKMTPRQLAQKFNINNLSKEVQQCLQGNSKDSDKEFDIIHAVQPRTDLVEGKVTKDNLPYMSVYVEVDSRHVIEEGGFHEMPYIVSRFMKSPTEIYGRGPAINCLPRIKMINRMGYTVIRNAEKITDPPVLFPDDGVTSNPRMNAGSIVYIRASMYENKPVSFETKANIPVGLDMIEREEIAINRSFYTDLFDTLADRRNMTATEVIERVEKKLLLFVPIMARIQAEKITPLLERCLGIAERKGMLPPMPEILKQNPNYEIKYTGKLALALKSLDIAAIAETLEIVGPYVETDPEILRNFDFNAIARGIAIRKGAPEEFMRSKEELAREEMQKAKEMQKQEMMNAVTQGADAASKLQKTTEPNSPLQAIGDALQGGGQ